MKVYPKIPRHDHPVVPEDFFAADDLTVLEKFDGSSFRFTCYEDRFADAYPDRVVEAASGDGSLVFGTRRSVRGSASDPLDSIDGALHRAVRCLREGIDAAALRAAQGEYGGPLTVYAENMVYSTLDYGYTEGSLPALIGFDALPLAAVDAYTPPGNPYAETFEGFLDLDATLALFERIRRDVSVERSFALPATVEENASGVDPAGYAVPTSSLAADVRAEGVVFRSDARARRVKRVRESFREVNRERFGGDPDAAETGAEYVVATYCTAARIRSAVRTMVVEEDREFGLHLNEDLYPRVVRDIWAENWADLMDLDRSFVPADVYPLVARRCIEELRAMETNAELNDADPTSIWRHLS